MDKKENRDFISKTESLVKPQDITAISFLGDFNQLLPKKAQQKIMKKGSEKIPYMGFIVDPYALFLAYEIEDRTAAQAMLPPGYELVESSLFTGEAKKPLAIFSAFYARTSAFIGTRLECYLIARDKKNGQTSWIIADYITDTNSHDPKNGFCGYNTKTALFTTTPYGELLINMTDNEERKVFSLSTELESGHMEELDEDLWIEGNFLVDYGGTLKDESSNPFSLIFDPILMKEAKKIPLDKISLKENSFLNDIIDPGKPLSAALFPYSQHFIIKQDLAEPLKHKEELTPFIKNFVERKKFKTMKGDDIKKPLFRGMLISSLVNMGILIYLFIRAFF